MVESDHFVAHGEVKLCCERLQIRTSVRGFIIDRLNNDAAQGLEFSFKEMMKNTPVFLQAVMIVRYVNAQPPSIAL